MLKIHRLAGLAGSRNAVPAMQLYRVQGFNSTHPRMRSSLAWTSRAETSLAAQTHTGSLARETMFEKGALDRNSQTVVLPIVITRISERLFWH